MASKQGATVLAGSTEVVEAQKPVQLTTEAQKFACVGVWVSADSGNTGKAVAIGHSKAGTEAKPKAEKGLVLYEKAAPVFIEISDPSLLWVDAETSKDKVTWLLLLA